MSDIPHRKVFSCLFLQVNALKHISLKPHPNFIKFIEDFKVNERPCLVFELLHMDLLEFTKHHETCIANLKAIRPIAQQVRVQTNFRLKHLHPPKVLNRRAEKRKPFSYFIDSSRP